MLVLNHQGCECFQNELSLFVAKQPKVSHGERSICPTRSSPPVACTAHKILLGTFVLLCSQVFQKVPLDRSPAADAPVFSAPASPARRTRPQPVHFFLAPCACFFVAVVISWLLVLHKTTGSHAWQDSSRALTDSLSRYVPLWVVTKGQPRLGSWSSAPKQNNEPMPKVCCSRSDRDRRRIGQCSRNCSTKTVDGVNVRQPNHRLQRHSLNRAWGFHPKDARTTTVCADGEHRSEQHDQ